MNIRLKDQRSRSQGQEMQKGDRVAGVSYALYRVASLYSWILCLDAGQVGKVLCVTSV